MSHYKANLMNLRIVQLKTRQCTHCIHCRQCKTLWCCWIRIAANIDHFSLWSLNRTIIWKEEFQTLVRCRSWLIPQPRIPNCNSAAPIKNSTACCGVSNSTTIWTVFSRRSSALLITLINRPIFFSNSSPHSPMTSLAPSCHSDSSSVIAFSSFT